MNSSVMFSRKTDEWSTPVSLMAELNCEFAFDLDVAATFQNRTCHHYLGPDHRKPSLRDALSVAWHEEVKGIGSLTQGVSGVHDGLYGRGSCSCPHRHTLVPRIRLGQ
jgi:hypothetical protein